MAIRYDAPGGAGAFACPDYSYTPALAGGSACPTEHDAIGLET